MSTFSQHLAWMIGLAASVSAATNQDESKVAPYTLPELFTQAGGSEVTTFGQWEAQRRAELLEIFSREVYGVSPPRPPTLAFRLESSDPAAMDGAATRKRVRIEFGTGGEKFSFPLTIFVPNKRSGPASLFLLLNHRPPENTDVTRKNRSEFWPAEEVINRGFAIAAVDVGAEVEPDKPDAPTGIRAFYRSDAKYTWGALAAWAWAGSRAMDYFLTDADIDSARVAVIGHSRSGKAALWAAASDTRFALACVNGAGEGGPALSRRNFGESLAHITTRFPHWFTPQYATYAGKESTLPIDQHQLVALVAPRGYHGGDGVEDRWADPRGSYLALAEASKVWALASKTSVWPAEPPAVGEMKSEGPLAYHLREGGHDLTLIDWTRYMDHAARIWKTKDGE